MKTVLLRAPVLTQSGYGVHSRQIAKWLFDRGSNVVVGALPWGNTPWLLADEPGSTLIQQCMSRSVAITSKPDISFQVQLPNEWDPKAATFNVGVTAGVETDRCNPEWVAASNRMSAIVVPSEHTKNVIVKTGQLSVPIHVIPESYQEHVVSTNLPQIPQRIDEELRKTDFNLLVFGQITGTTPQSDRKNLFNTIKWLYETFDKESNVGIVVKTNASRNTRIDRQNVVDLLTNLVKQLRKNNPKGPRVLLVHGQMTDAEVASLYKHETIKALVTLTRGEGYGLPILEAATSGLPVIAPAWSGHMEFMKHGKFVAVDYELKQIHESRIDKQIFMPGSRWAEASESDFKRKMKKFYQSSNTPKEWATSLSSVLRDKFSHGAVSKIYESTFGEIL